MGQIYRRMEDKKLLHDLACNQDFAKRRWKMSKLGNVLSKLELVKCITDGGLGVEPQAAGRLWVIFEKKNYSNVIESHSARVWSHLEELDF